MTTAEPASGRASRAMRTNVKMSVMRGALAATTAALMAASALAQAPAQPAAAPVDLGPVQESVAIVVNDEPISTYDIRQRMLLLFALTGAQPSQQNLPQYQQEALRSLVEERLQRQELRRFGSERRMNLIVEDEVVNQEVAGLAQEARLTPEQFAQQLQVRGLTMNELREYRRSQISWQSFVRAFFRTRVQVSPRQVDAYLERQRAAQSRPQFQISEIFIDPARVGGMQEAVFGATQLLAQLQQGAPFPAVARQFSASATATRGGDAGWVSAADVDPAVAATLEQMRPGQLSQPIQTADGVYIVALRDRRTGAGQATVHLKQAAIRLNADAPADQVAAARQRLTDLRTRITGCDNVEAVVTGVEGVLAGDLGTTPVSDLTDQFRTATESLQPNQASEVIQSPIGLHVLVLCSRGQQGPDLPSRTEVENRLRAEQYELYARRYLRDLQTSAIIDTRS